MDQFWSGNDHQWGNGRKNGEVHAECVKIDFCEKHQVRMLLINDLATKLHDNF